MGSRNLKSVLKSQIPEHIYIYLSIYNTHTHTHIYIYIYIYIYITYPPFLKIGGSKFRLPPLERGKSKKLKKGWKYGAVAGLLERVGGSSLHLEITLPFAKLCYAFEEKLLFYATLIL